MAEKKIRKLGYLWTFSTNSQLAEIERDKLEYQSRQHAMQQKKPSEKSAALTLFEYYSDVISSLANLELNPPLTENEKKTGGREGVKDPDAFVIELVDNPYTWLELARELWGKNEYKTIRELWDCACSVNPQWYAKDPVKEVAADNPEAKESLEILEAAKEALDPDNGLDHPDTEELIEAASTLSSAVENDAKKKG